MSSREGRTCRCDMYLKLLEMKNLLLFFLCIFGLALYGNTLPLDELSQIDVLESKSISVNIESPKIDGFEESFYLDKSGAVTVIDDGCDGIFVYKENKAGGYDLDSWYSPCANNLPIPCNCCN